MRHTVRPHRFTLCSPSLCCGCCYCVLFFALGIRYHQELLREVMQAASSAVFSSAPSSPAFLRLRSHKGNSIVAPAVGNPTTESMAAKWAQKTVVIPPQRRGCHLITSKVPSSTSLVLFLNPRTQIELYPFVPFVLVMDSVLFNMLLLHCLLLYQIMFPF